MSQMDVIDDLCLPPSGEGRSKIHLVRGPPGSGKTMTLNAILNAIHVQQYTAYYDAIAEAVKNGKFSTNERSWLDLTKISKPRIIVCAPSNVAIDNIILRIYTEKFLDGHCREYIPRLVRIGKGGQNNPQVAERALARLVEKQLKKPGRDVVEKISKLESLYSEYRHGVLVQVTKLHVMISGTPHAFRAGIETRVATNPDGLLAPYWVDHTNQTTSNSLPPAAAIGEPTAPQVEHMQEYLLYARELMRFLELWENTHWKLQRYRLVQAYIQESVATTSAAAERYQIATNLETLFLNQASIVCGTLSSSGLSQVCDSLPFHTCVVDEAAQSVELSTLIPLRLGVKKLVLVGDPQQLPATVICKREKLGNYERSLFERLESCGLPVHTLNLQYRMHPAISHFPRHVFYQGTLQDSPVVSSRKSPFFSDPPFNMNPVMFIDIKASRDVVSESTWSRSNPDEANICVSLYLALVRIAKSSNTTLAGRVGVISPYADQIKLLRSRFDAAGGIATTDDIEIATVDSFQGKEKDIIILSTVRACSESNSVGFLSDLRRMNVAITRAKFGLFVVGRAETLRANPTWAMLVDNAHQTKNGYLEISNCDRDVYDVLAEQIFQKPMPPSIAQPSLYPTL
jgi:senataxin